MYMAYEQIPGQGLLIPDWNLTSGAATAMTSTTAIGNGGSGGTTHKIAFCGRVFHKSRNLTGNPIVKIGVRTGTVTKTALSDLKLSIQGVSTSAGPPYQPDGSIKGSGAGGFATIATGDLVSAGWNHSGALGASVTVAFGDLIAVVAESPSWAASDLIPLAGMTAAASGPWQTSGTVYYNGATWAGQAIIPNVILEFNDGTFGTLDGGWPVANFSNQSFNTGTITANEYALQFTLPFNYKVDSAWFLMTCAAGADFNMVLTDATGTALTGGSVSVDYNTTLVAGSPRYCHVTFSQEVTLSANTTYQLSLDPTTTNSITTYYTSVNSTNHFQAMHGGTAWKEVRRLDSGAFSETGSGTRRPVAGIRLSSFDIAQNSTLAAFGGN
jgi:hypothetical protein